MMRGCDPCAQDSDGYTAAHYAVERDDVEMLKALTIRFHSQVKPIPDQQITAIHEKCLQALTLKNKQGLTVFMLACHHESLKCLNYLIELNINDCHFEVN
jgi:ankyrin repeat protein